MEQFPYKGSDNDRLVIQTTMSTLDDLGDKLILLYKRSSALNNL